MEQTLQRSDDSCRGSQAFSHARGHFSSLARFARRTKKKGRLLVNYEARRPLTKNPIKIISFFTMLRDNAGHWMLFSFFFSHLALPRATSHVNDAERMMASLKLGLTFNSANEILWCDHSNESSLAVLSHGTIYLVCSSNF